MEMFISIVVLVVAPFGLLLVLERDVASEAERAIHLFTSRTRAEAVTQRDQPMR